MTSIDSLPDASPLPELALLPEFAVFRASGADAATFLHGQLTQDIEHLAPGSARMAGYCSPKGRLLASMVAWSEPNAETGHPDILLLARADAAAALTRRLAMFILRAKVKISLTNQPVYGANVDNTTVKAATLGGHALPLQAWQCADLPGGTWITLPTGSETALHGFYVAAQPANEPGSPAAATPAQQDDVAHTATTPATSLADDWRRATLQAGLPWIGGATADLFIPQNVNFDCIGAINFRKGCYPGQEVVARSHYRGTLKRRMGFGTLPSDPGLVLPAGSDVYDPARPQEPAGRIVDSAPGAVLLEAPLDSLEAGVLRHGAVDGPEIRIGKLPYSLDKPAN